MSSRSFSIVEYFAEHEGYRCGYCKSTDTNYSHGMWAHNMTVQDYQDLIDRGWRRSGRYCYKPTMHITCCPMYTIRCAALDYKISKSQKKVLKRLHRFLSQGDTKAGDDSKSAGGSFVTSDTREFPEVMDIPDLHQKALRAESNSESTKVAAVDPSVSGRSASGIVTLCKRPYSALVESGLQSALNQCVTQPVTECDDTRCCNNTTEPPEDEHEKKLDGEGCVQENEEGSCKTDNLSGDALISLAATAGEMQKSCRPGIGPDANRPPCKKAKLMRLERKHQKLLDQGLTHEAADAMLKQKKPQQQEGKSLEDLLSEPLPANPAHRLEIRLVRSSPPSREFEQTKQQAYEVYRKYQMAIHGDPPDKCTDQHYTRFLVNSPLQLVLLKVGSPEFRRSLVDSQVLFAKYQMVIHNETPEECNPRLFYEFLVDSPLEPWHPMEGPPQGYGSFHQQYWMNGRLIAVGVIDILPRCVSSVYFYYDPELGHLSLGTYASLREIFLTRSLHGHASSLQYYYMGFYIHTCPKMQYKASYNPSFLLCPEVYTWHPVGECKAGLDRSRYCRFNDDPSAKDKDGDVDLNEIRVLFNQRAMEYWRYLAMSQTGNDALEVSQYTKLVGMKCARRMLLFRP